VAPGSLFMAAIPSKWNISLSSSSWRRFASFLDICSNWPSCCILRSSCRRSIRFLTVLKLVSMPPIQRRLTKYIPQRAASVLEGARRRLLRADEEHGPAACGDAAREVPRLVKEPDGLLQVDDVD